MASCGSSTAVMTSFEEPVLCSNYGTFTREQKMRRRHSSHHTTHAGPSDNVTLLLENFIAELGCRLDFLESYGHVKFDAGVEYAYSTLHAVRESCSKISDGALEAGRRRAGVFVETLEERYKGALASKESLEQKVQEGVRLLESYLTEFETSAYAIRDAGISTVAQDIYEGGRRRVGEGLESAKGVVDGGLDKARRARDKARETIEVTIEHAVERALARAKEHGLIKYEDLPDPWRVNPHILKGYRFSEGPWACVRSVFGFHNELFNIWSHAVGLILVLAVAFYFYPRNVNFSLSTNADVFVAAVFFFAACKCLVCSTIWHTMNSISHQTLLERFACVDYTGISFLVASSIITTEYAAFYCEPTSRWVYMLTTAALGIGGVILPWHPTFNKAENAWLRVMFYVSLALTGFLPVGQLAMSRGVQWAIYFYSPVVKSVLVYFVGACLYACKVPERWFPGMFDYVGCSHNLWHVAVLGGILFHYTAMQDMFSQAILRAQSQCPVR